MSLYTSIVWRAGGGDDRQIAIRSPCDRPTVDEVGLCLAIELLLRSDKGGIR